MRFLSIVLSLSVVTAGVAGCAPSPLPVSVSYQKAALTSTDGMLPVPAVSAKPAPVDAVVLGEQRKATGFTITLPRGWAVDYERTQGDERDVAAYHTQASAWGVGNLLVRRYDLGHAVTPDEALRITSDQVRQWGAKAAVTAILTDANGQNWGVSYQTTVPKEPKSANAGEVVTVNGSAYFVRNAARLLVVDLQGDKDTYSDALAAAVARSFTLK